MGFLDTFDDTLAEAFFCAFYGAWGTPAEPGWPATDLPTAFVTAWTAIRSSGPSLLGSGVTLWSDSPLLGAGMDDALRSAARRGTGPGTRRPGTGTLPPWRNGDRVGHGHRLLIRRARRGAGPVTLPRRGGRSGRHGRTPPSRSATCWSIRCSRAPTMWWWMPAR